MSLLFFAAFPALVQKQLLQFRERLGLRGAFNGFFGDGLDFLVGAFKLLGQLGAGRQQILVARPSDSFRAARTMRSPSNCLAAMSSRLLASSRSRSVVSLTA